MAGGAEGGVTGYGNLGSWRAALAFVRHSHGVWDVENGVRYRFGGGEFPETTSGLSLVHYGEKKQTKKKNLASPNCDLFPYIQTEISTNVSLIHAKALHISFL